MALLKIARPLKIIIAALLALIGPHLEKHMTKPASPDLAARLAAFLAHAAGAPVTITGMRPIAGGASRETWAVDAVIGGAQTALVLRMDLASSMNPDALSRPQEFALLAAAHAAGVLAPRPRWLVQRAPRCAQPTLLHGDFRIGNLLVGPAGLGAVIDWEFAHVGDPHEDLAWPCVRDWRFGNDALHVGGVGELAPYLAAYTAASGRAVDRNALRWWEIMGNLRWATTCHIQAHRHLSGADPSVELASLGRRAAEMELEFLTLIEATE